MSKAGQHPPMAEQLAALAAEIEGLRGEGGAEAAHLADKGATILARARELASEIAMATRDVVTDGAARIRREAQDEVEAVRAAVRRDPVLWLGSAAIAAALLTSLARGVSRMR